MKSNNIFLWTELLQYKLHEKPTEIQMAVFKACFTTPRTCIIKERFSWAEEANRFQEPPASPTTGCALLDNKKHGMVLDQGQPGILLLLVKSKWVHFSIKLNT